MEKQMEKSITKKVEMKVPELRFPGFEGEWCVKLVNDLGKIITGSTPSTSNSNFYGGEIPFISPADVSDEKYIAETKTTLTESGFKKCRKIPANSIVFVCIGSTIGKVGVTSLESATNQQINSVVSNEKNHADFIYSVLEKESARIRLLSGKQAVPIINKTAFSKIKLHLPTLPEQKKIAAFLSAVDQKIHQLTRKQELLAQYKKGVMQQLFPAPGERNPRLRFKNEKGEDFPDWEVKRLGDCFSFLSTNSHSRDKLNYEGGEFRNIHYGDIHTKFSKLFILKEEKVPFLNKGIEVKSKDLCKEGDVVFADASEDYNDIGKCIELVELGNEKVVSGLHTFLARPDKNERMAKGFAGYLFGSWGLRKQIMVIAQGTKVLGIAKSRMEKLILPVPVIGEQRKISTFLSRLDVFESYLLTEINNLKTFKKGLLQKLFV